MSDAHDYPDLDALLGLVDRVGIEPPVLRERLVEVLKETAQLRTHLEVVADLVHRLPDSRGAANLRQAIDWALHGKPRLVEPPTPSASTVETWAARIEFELAQWTQLPIEETTAALERLEKYAGALVDEAIDQSAGVGGGEE